MAPLKELLNSLIRKQTRCNYRVEEDEGAENRMSVENIVFIFNLG